MTRLAMVRVGVRVPVDPERAFEMFTGEIDQWYVKNRHTIGAWAADSTLRLEPGVGGQLLHQSDGEEPRVMATVTTWEPGRALGLVDADGCEIDVTFAAVETGARVILEQRGLERYPEGEPRVRFGWRVVLPWFEAHVRYLYQRPPANEEEQ